MSSSSQLAVAYIARSPQSASRVLTGVSPEEAADFVKTIPPAQAASLIACATPQTASRIMQNVDDEAVAAIFAQLDLRQASAIVRQMNRAGRSAFVPKLPRRTRAALEKQLAFPPDTVGANMTAAFCALLESDTVATALDVIRQSDQGLGDAVFVTDPAGRLAGTVSSATLLRHSGNTLLSTIVDSSCPDVAAFARLDVLRDPAVWHDFVRLPVVDRQRIVIGAISRRVLTTGRLADTTDSSDLLPQSMPGAVFGALVTTSTGLLRLLLPPATGQETGRRDGDD